MIDTNMTDRSADEIEERVAHLIREWATQDEWTAIPAAKEIIEICRQQARED